MGAIIRGGSQPSDLDLSLAAARRAHPLRSADAEDVDPSAADPMSDEPDAAPGEPGAQSLLRRIGMRSGGQEARVTTESLLPQVGADATSGVDPHADEPPEHIGIVVLHGIGSQKPAVDMLDWTSAIDRALVAWRRRNHGELVGATMPVDGVEKAQIDFDGGTFPLVSIQVPGLGDHHPQTWTFTEAWWAQSIEPPTLRMMVDWNGRDGVLATVVTQVLDHNTEGARWFGPALGRLGLRLFVSTIGSLALLGFLALENIAGLLPIPGLQDSAILAGMNSFLVGWWGDARVLVRDPVQAANVRARLVAAIRALRSEHCSAIILIAHSGGTIVAYQTLTDPEYPKLGIDKLITHGEAIGLARLFDDDRTPQPPLLPRNAPSADRTRGHMRVRTTRWRDFWASHDPAPNGKLKDLTDAEQTREPQNEARLSYEVWNFRSILDDHGTYWDNDEEFVLRVIRELDTPKSPSTASRFTDPAATPAVGPGASPVPTIVQRRRERVLFRSIWGRTALVAPVVALLLAFLSGQSTPGGPAPLHQLLQDALGVWTQLPIAMSVGSVLTGIATWLAPNAAAITFAGGIAWSVVFLSGVAYTWWPAGHLDTWTSPLEMLFAGIVDFTLSGIAIGAAILATIQLFVTGSHSSSSDPEAIAVAILVVCFAWFAFNALHWRHWLRKKARISTTLQSVASSTKHLRTAVHRCRDAIATGAETTIVLAGITAAVSALFVSPETDVWVIGAAITFVLVQIFVRIGFWRWSAWDDRERQRLLATDAIGWRTMPYIELTVLLGALAIAVYQLLYGLPAAWSLTVLGVIGLVILEGVIRDASTAERPRKA